MMHRKLTLSLALLTTLSACGNDAPHQAPTSPQQPTGDQTGSTTTSNGSNTAVAMELVPAPGFELVLRHCVTCHGPRQFLQQRGDRATWLGLIRWMQKDHGMQPLPTGVEDPLVDYLAKHYGPEHQGRRKPLRADLLPPNPYGN